MRLRGFNKLKMRKRRVAVFAGLIAAVIGIISLLKNVEKEQKVIDTKNEVILAEREVESDTNPKELLDRGYDTGYNIAPLIFQMIDVERKLERLEESISKNNDNEYFTSAFQFAPSDYSNSVSVGKAVEKSINNQKDLVQSVRDEFEEFRNKNRNEIEEILRRGGKLENKYANIPLVQLYNAINEKKHFRYVVDELERSQGEVNAIFIILSRLPKSSQILEIERRLNKLNEEITKELEKYDILINGLDLIIAIWSKALSEFDIDGSRRREMEEWISDLK